MVEEVTVPVSRHIKSIFSETASVGLWVGFRARPQSLAVSQPSGVDPGPAVFISGCHLEITRGEDMGELAQMHPSCSPSSVSKRAVFLQPVWIASVLELGVHLS